MAKMGVWFPCLEGPRFTSENERRKFVKVDKSLRRPSDVQYLLGNCSKARRILKWKPKYNFEGLVKDMVKADLEFVEKYGY